MKLLDADLTKCQETEGKIASNDSRPLQCRYIQPGAHLGGGGGLRFSMGLALPPFRDLTPADPKGPPL